MREWPDACFGNHQRKKLFFDNQIGKSGIGRIARDLFSLPIFSRYPKLRFIGLEDLDHRRRNMDVHSENQRSYRRVGGNLADLLSFPRSRAIDHDPSGIGAHRHGWRSAQKFFLGPSGFLEVRLSVILASGLCTHSLWPVCQ